MSQSTIGLPPILYSMLSHTGREAARYANPDILLAHRQNHDRNRTVLCATDGHRLALVEWDADMATAPFKALVPNQSVKALRAPKSKNCFRPWTGFSGYVATVDTGPAAQVTSLSLDGVEVKCCPPEQRSFPPYDDVIPRYEEENRSPDTPFFALNPHFVIDAMKLHADAARLLVKEARRGVTFWNQRWNKPVLIRDDYESVQVTSLIMPVNPYADFNPSELAADCAANTRRHLGLEPVEAA